MLCLRSHVNQLVFVGIHRGTPFSPNFKRTGPQALGYTVLYASPCCWSLEATSGQRSSDV